MKFLLPPLIPWCLAVFFALGCNQTGECVNAAADHSSPPPLSSPLMADLCPDPLSSYSPGAPTEALYPSWDSDTLIAGALAPVTAGLSCSTIVVGLSTAGSCTLPDTVDVAAGVIDQSGLFLARLLATVSLKDAEVSGEGDNRLYHLALPKGLGAVSFDATDRPVIGIRVPLGICPVESIPACGARLVTVTPDGAIQQRRTPVFGLENCEQD